MTLPSAQDVTNMYLYGQSTTPNKTSDTLIRPDFGVTHLQVHVNEFMITGAGRFAVGAQFDLVKDFFNNGASVLAVNTVAKPFYTKAEVASAFGLTSYAFNMDNKLFADSTNDYGSRVYIYNNTAFQISDNAQFVVQAGGVLKIDYFGVLPRTDVQENFDFHSDQNSTSIGNVLLEPAIDPSHIGRTVDIDFIDTRTLATYTQTQYNTDLTKIGMWSSVPPLNSSIADVALNLWTSGATKFLEDATHPILYGTNGVDTIDGNHLPGSTWADIYGVPTIADSDYQTQGVVIYGGAGSDTLIGTARNDSLYGGADNDSLIGGAGNDTLDGGSGTNILDGGADIDTVTYVNSAVGVTVNMKTGVASTGDTVLNVERLIASTHNDSITGGDGDNTIEGGAGADTINGGLGIDTISYEHSSAAVNVNLSIATAQSGGDAAGDILSNVENVIGSAFNDSLAGGLGNNILTGGAGADTFKYTYTADASGNKTSGVDIILDPENADRINFNGTVLTGTPPGIVIDGTYFFGSFSNPTAIVWFKGNDLYIAKGTSAVAHTGNPGFEITYTPDLIVRGYLQGVGAGASSYTFMGMTFPYPAAEPDSKSGAQFDDANNYYYPTYAYTIPGETVAGGTGNDSLAGGTGNDTINGGTGSDTLTGGLGATDNDQFVIANANTATTITDFAHNVDKVDLSAFTAATSISGIAIAQSGANTVISVAHDDGSAAAAITLTGVTASTLTANDFIFAPTTAQTINATADDDVITSGSGNDSINGFAGNDTIYAGAGNDVIQGGDGNDFIVGGAGSDYIDGGAGVDTVSYASSSALVVVDLATPNFYSGDAAYDNLVNIENIIGSAFNDTITGNAVANSIEGGAGNDVLTGNDGNDTLVGGAGNDQLYGGNGDDLLIGGIGSDLLDGGAGIDTVSYAQSASGVWVNVDLSANNNWNGDAAWDNIMNVENVIGSDYNDNLVGNAVANVLTGGLGNDTIAGNDGDDTLVGGDGDDTLTGGNGNDVLKGGLGSDYIDGGAGIDTVTYETSSTWVSVNLATNGHFNGDASYDSIVNVENITGSNFDDFLTGNTSANILSGGLGNDVLNGGAGNDTLIGGEGNDTLIGGAGIDSLDGGNGLDTADYSASTAAINVNLALATSQVGGDAQGDILLNTENLIGSAYNDTLTGTSAANIISGGAGNDNIVGGDGNDQLYGGDGNDTINGGLGSDLIDGGNGIDTVTYATSSAFVNVDLSANSVFNSDASFDNLLNVENLTGSGYNDILVGNAGANVINGGNGNDNITGKAGVDTLIGGAGLDHFIYTLATDSGVGAGNRDVINDFSHAQGDLIDLSGFTGTFSFLGTGAFSTTGTATQVRYFDDGTNTIVQVDATGSHSANFEIQLVGHVALTASDFVL